MALDVTFDLDRLRVPTAPDVLRPPASATPATVPPARRSRPRPNPLPRHQPGEHFLKGPIPWTWLTLAMRQPGKTLHVANAIWQRAGMARSRTIKLSLSSLDAHGV